MDEVTAVPRTSRRLHIIKVLSVIAVVFQFISIILPPLVADDNFVFKNLFNFAAVLLFTVYVLFVFGKKNNDILLTLSFLMTIVSWLILFWTDGIYRNMTAMEGTMEMTQEEITDSIIFGHTLNLLLLIPAIVAFIGRLAAKKKMWPIILNAVFDIPVTLMGILVMELNLIPIIFSIFLCFFDGQVSFVELLSPFIVTLMALLYAVGCLLHSISLILFSFDFSRRNKELLLVSQTDSNT